MAKLPSRYQQFLESPPLWVRAIAVFALALAGFGLAARRGWIVGVVAAIVYGGITVPMLLSPGGVAAWSRRHPLLDGSILGPLLFLALAYVTHLALWICLVIGAAGVPLGRLQGARRGRRRALED